MSIKKEDFTFTVVVPVLSSNVHLVSFTLDSIVNQLFSSFEIVVVYEEAIKDRCSSILTSYPRPIKTLQGTSNNFCELVNQAIKISLGKYIHVLTPSEFYISRRVFSLVAQCIEEHSFPDLIYSGYIIRHSLSPSQVVMQPIAKEDLKGGRVCSTLLPYWIDKNVLDKLGGFNPRYKSQGGFDFICRFFQDLSLKKIFMKRVLADYEYRKRSSKNIIRHFVETLWIICIHFGVNKALLWWMAQNHGQLLLWSLKNLKGAFWKKEV